jgi:hypothetical protein
LLPAVREAARDTLIVADGFSCQEQIAQTTDRRALHLAEVIRMALHQPAEGSQQYGSEPYVLDAEKSRSELVQAMLLGGSAVLAGALLGMLFGQRSGSLGHPNGNRLYRT